MKKITRLSTGLVIAAALLVPVFAGALTADELKAQINSLLAQIVLLQQKIVANNTANTNTTVTTSTVNQNTNSNAASSAGVVCPVFNLTLSRGSRGDAVTALQKFLATQGFITADAVTGFFGPTTESAVRNFQAQQSIVSSGSAATTGWGSVGKLTSAAIVRVCSNTNTTPTVTTPAPNACTYNPIPTTSCNGTWTPSFNSSNCLTAWKCVSTVPQCTLQALSCPAGQHSVANGCSQSCVSDTCQPSQLSVDCAAGYHYTGNTYTTDSNGCQVPHAGQCINNTSTFSATPSSGAAPLTVGFYVGNFSGTPDQYSIDFGDGSGTNNSGNWSRSVEGASLYMAHTYTDQGTYTATLKHSVTSTNGGTAALQSIGTASITVSGQCQLSQLIVDCVAGYHYTGNTYTTDSNGCQVPHAGQCVAN